MKEKYFQNSNGVEKRNWVDETQYSNLNKVDVESTEVFCTRRAPQKPKVIGNLQDILGDGGMLKVDGE